MDVQDKLAILADAAKYDASCSSSGSKATRAGSRIGSTEGMGICHSYTPDGRCISLLKILLTNFCIYDCQYCVNRISSDTPRARFTVPEVVTLTLDFYKRNGIDESRVEARGLGKAPVRCAQEDIDSRGCRKNRRAESVPVSPYQFRPNQ